jgi:uncharacterized protein with ATP-grasp and redox domains
VIQRPCPFHPPAILTSDPDSFAAFTLSQRLPKILDQIITGNGLSTTEAAGLLRLKQRLHTGTVEDCFSAHPELRDRLQVEEYATWNREIGAHIGSSWLDLPWYLAESLFYLEILLAWGYYSQDSPRCGVDPFQSIKEEELLRPGGALDLAARIDRETRMISSMQDKLLILLRYCLWANRLDLSYSQLLEKYRGGLEIQTSTLLVDHTDRVTEKLLQAGRIDLILDNAGSELIADLYLVRELLQHSSKMKIVMHCKVAPFFVSDAMIKDIRLTIDRLEQGSTYSLHSLGRSLSRELNRGSLCLRDHFFWNGPLHFPEIPEDLQRDLGQSDLIVLKGDANYRRLLSDRRWAPTTNMEAIVGYFPAALVTLRTTKSELAADLDTQTVERLDSSDPNWLVEGRYGFIRYFDPGC